MNTAHLDSPLGVITLTEEQGAITRLTWGGLVSHREGPTGVLADAAKQITDYFAGTLTSFDLPLNPAGSQLQKEVCAAMSAIPFGDTRTYGDLAKDIGVPAQAIGQACGGNPIPLIIPCHRVLGADGLGGFSGSGGIEDKVWLLKHEGAASLLI